MKKIVRLTESDLTRLVKRIIKENRNHNIKIGDTVDIPHMEFRGKVISINKDRTKITIKGPTGKEETFNIKDVLKVDDYEEEMITKKIFNILH